MSRSFKDSPEKRQQNFASKKERGAHRKMEPYSRSNMKVFAKEFYSVDGDYQRQYYTIINFKLNFKTLSKWQKTKKTKAQRQQ